MVPSIPRSQHPCKVTPMPDHAMIREGKNPISDSRLQLARQMIKSRTVQLEQDWTSIVYFEELPEGNLFYAWKKQNKKNNMVTLAELHLNFANQSLVQEHWTAYKLSNVVMEMWLFGFVLQQKDLGTFSHWVHHKPLCIAKYSRAIYHYRNSRVRPSIW